MRPVGRLLGWLVWALLMSGYDFWAGFAHLISPTPRAWLGDSRRQPLRYRVCSVFKRVFLGLARNWANLCGACPHCFARDSPKAGLFCPYHWTSLHPLGFGRVEPTRRERQTARGRRHPGTPRARNLDP